MSNLSAYGIAGHEGTQGPPGEASCNCSSRDLFNFGCRCNDRQFHLWFNGIDYVIARDDEEAKRVVKESLGYTDEEAEGDTSWFIVLPGREISIEEDEDVITTLTAEKWVGEIGKPEYLGSTEGP